MISFILVTLFWIGCFIYAFWEEERDRKMLLSLFSERLEHNHQISLEDEIAEKTAIQKTKEKENEV